METLERIQNRLAGGEELLLLTETDVLQDGAFGQRWFAVTSERIVTFSDGEREPVWETQAQTVAWFQRQGVPISADHIHPQEEER